MDIITKLGDYMQYDFVQKALIVGVLIALCSSLLGVTLVLKRFSFIGDGLSHVAFVAMAVAGIAGLTNEMILVLPITVIAAVVLLATGKNAKIKGDASLAMLSVASLGIGYLLLNVFSSSGNISGDVCTTLFGSTSILTLSDFDVKRSLCACSLCKGFVKGYGKDSVIEKYEYEYHYNRHQDAELYIKIRKGEYGG